MSICHASIHRAEIFRNRPDPETMTPPIRLDLLAAPLFVVLWSTGFIGAKYGLPHIEPVTFLVLRFALVVAALVFWVVLARTAWLTLAQARDAAIIGILLQAVYLGGIYKAIDLGVEAGVAALIVGLQPVLTAFLARQFLRERLSPVQWAGMALGMLGVEKPRNAPTRIEIAIVPTMA